MTLNELRYLVALATEGHFGRAARACHVSQPSLSIAITKIEGELGLKLFERRKRAVRPTQAGVQVVEQARIAIREAEKVQLVACALQDPLHGPIRLGIIPTVAPYILPQIVRELSRTAPRMPLIVEENLTASLAGMLHDNEIDIAMVALPFVSSETTLCPLYDESFVVIAPPSHPWAGLASISPDDINPTELLLLKAGNCFRDQVVNTCPQISMPESLRHPGRSLETLRSMVASGLGLSVLPESAIQGSYHFDAIRVIPFSNPRPSRRIALAWRTGFPRLPAVDKICQAVRTLNPKIFQILVPQSQSIMI